MKNSFDIIIVGSGTGGVLAARFAAQEGLSICLIDKKEKSRIGDKICGDAVGIQVFDLLGIEHPKGKELSCKIKGAKLYPPDMKNHWFLYDPRQTGYMLNRLEFGQRLLSEALNAGSVQLLDNTKAVELKYKNSAVIGLKVEFPNGEMADLKCKIVIDASGFNSPLRKNIKSSIIEKSISKDDFMIGYREIIKFSPDEQQVKDPEYITIILDHERAPGGYIWYFPKNKFSVNIGLGTSMSRGVKIRDYYKRYVFNQFITTSRYETVSRGVGILPLRRPLFSCADNGIMMIGDAAFHVNPLHGGGIDPSMIAGYYAAKTAVSAIKTGDCSINGLWEYNRMIMTGFGASFAGLDLLRIVLQNLSNKSLNFGIGKNLLSSSEILKMALTGYVSISMLDRLKKGFKGIRNPKLLSKFGYLFYKMKAITEHYKNFPDSIEDFTAWKENIVNIYRKFRK